MYIIPKMIDALSKSLADIEATRIRPIVLSRSAAGSGNAE